MTVAGHLARRKDAVVADSELLIALGAGPTGEVFRCTRGPERWIVEPAPSFVLLPDLVMLVLPDEPFWRAWVEPTPQTSTGNAADARFISWHPDASVSAVLPPLDVDPASIRRMPSGYSSVGLDFSVRFSLTGTPGGTLVAVLTWRDGVLVDQSREIPDDLAPDRIIDIHAPYVTLLRYLTRRSSIYSVLSAGSTVVGDPSFIQYMAGYVEQEASSGNGPPGRDRARSVIRDFLEFPPTVP